MSCMANRVLSLLKHRLLFEGIDKEVPIMCYHSIVVEKIPADFEVTAITTDDQEIMAIQHKHFPVYGLQYHPESIGSPDGLKMIENFVNLVKHNAYTQ